MDVWLRLRHEPLRPSLQSSAASTGRTSAGPPTSTSRAATSNRGWFQTSLLNSVATRGTAPYRMVLTHGFIMGPRRSENVEIPRQRHEAGEDNEKNGADILRLWVASSDYRGDVRISEEIFRNLIESYPQNTQHGALPAREPRGLQSRRGHAAARGARARRPVHTAQARASAFTRD